MTAKSQKTKGSAQPIDAHVGQKLRVRRSLLGMSQEKLADRVGITFQQIQKYERGTNRVSSSRLYEFSNILGVPVGYFFPDQEETPPNTEYGLADNEQQGFSVEEEDDMDVMKRKETIKLVRMYYKIDDKKLRQSILSHIKTLANFADE